MRIRTLRMNCDDDPMKLEVWVDCCAPEDIDDLIAWLKLGKDVLIKWGKIREHAKASRPKKASAGKNEDAKRREIQDQPQPSIGTDRTATIETNAIKQRP